MDVDKIKRVEDQILADDELIVMDHDTADTLVTIAESVLICDILQQRTNYDIQLLYK